MDPPSGVYLHHSPNEKSTNKLSMKIIEPNDFPKPSSHAPESHASSSSSTITQSTASSSGELPVPPPKKRARISKACQHCRKKKIKCDGGKPCNNCVQSNGGNCVYEEDPERKIKIPTKRKTPGTSKTPVKQTQTIKELDERLLRIELMLSDLTTELQASRVKPPVVSDTTLSEITEESEAEDPQSNPEIESNALRSYAASHVFSKESVSSMLLFLDGKDETAKQKYEEDINSMGEIYNYYAQAFLDTVCQPIKTRLRKRFELMDSIFTDETLPLAILNHYYDRIFFLRLIIDRKYLVELFEKYYKEKNMPNRQVFKWSELLIMSAAIGLTVSLILDERNMGKTGESELINNLNDVQLVEINSKCFYSMVLYYNRLCFISEGLSSIQALVFFVIYLESIISSVRVNLIPLTIAVKYAQDLGLHLHETYQGLSWDEQVMRKTLWWFCEYYSIEYSTRAAQPLNLTLDEIMSLEDVSSNAVIKSNWSLLESYFKSPNDKSILSKIHETNSTHKCVSYMMYCLSKIRIKSFDLLYKSNCKMTVAQLINNLELLNEEMKTVNNAPLSFKFYDDDQFMFNSKKSVSLVKRLDNGYENYLFLNFVYFQHLMTINRIKIPSTAARKYIEKVNEFTSIANKSARTVLHIAKSLELDELPSTTYSSILYYPYFAFLHLATSCISHPHQSDIEQDLKLLIDVSMFFFAYKLDSKTVRIKRNCVRQLFYDLLTRYLLNIVIKLIDGEVSKRLFKKYKNLKNHLNMLSNFKEFFIEENQIGINKSHTNQVLRKWFSPYELVKTNTGNINIRNNSSTPVSISENITSQHHQSSIPQNSQSIPINENNQNNNHTYQQLGLPPQQQQQQQHYNEYNSEYRDSSASSMQQMFQFPIHGPDPNSASSPGQAAARGHTAYNRDQYPTESLLPTQQQQQHISNHQTPMSITPQLPQPPPPQVPQQQGMLPVENIFHHTLSGIGLNTNFINFDEVDDYNENFFNPNTSQQQQQQRPL